jgi:hypothetical protein
VTDHINDPKTRQQNQTARITIPTSTIVLVGPTDSRRDYNTYTNVHVCYDYCKPIVRSGPAEGSPTRAVSHLLSTTTSPKPSPETSKAIVLIWHTLLCQWKSLGRRSSEFPPPPPRTIHPPATRHRSIHAPRNYHNPFTKHSR